MSRNSFLFLDMHSSFPTLPHKLQKSKPWKYVNYSSLAKCINKKIKNKTKAALEIEQFLSQHCHKSNYDPVVAKNEEGK